MAGQMPPSSPLSVLFPESPEPASCVPVSFVPVSLVAPPSSPLTVVDVTEQAPDAIAIPHTAETMPNQAVLFM
jgi:hypothetical protein